MPQKITCEDYAPRVALGIFWGCVAALFVCDLINYFANHYSILWPVITIVGFTVSSVLFFWCYFIACWGDPGFAEQFYKNTGIYDKIIAGEISGFLSSLPLCEKCHLPKPKRTHHCSHCDQCVFRFDHHCPVIGNCVGLYNFKAFILMPIYAFFILMFIVIEISVNHSLYMLILIVPMFALFCGFSLSYLGYILENVTTLEAITLTRDPSFSDGYRKNFIEFFEPFPKCLIPTRPKISGFHWSDKNIINNFKI